MNDKIVNFLKTPWGIFVLTYFGLAMTLVIIAFVKKAGDFDTIGSYMIKTGLAVFTICLVIFGRGTGGRADGSAQSIYYSNDKYFKNVRGQEAHLRLVIKQIIFASILLAITGLLMIVMVG